jgi:hypothetical protein
MYVMIAESALMGEKINTVAEQELLGKSSIKTTAALRKAIEDLEQDNECRNLVNRADVLKLIDSFEAGVREQNFLLKSSIKKRIKELEDRIFEPYKEEGDSNRKCGDMIRREELRRVLSSNEIPEVKRRGLGEKT